MRNMRWMVCGLVALAASAGCDSADDVAAAIIEVPGESEARPVLENYAELVYANYQEALTTAQAMKAAIDTFVGTPTDANLTAAKNAWLAARVPYGRTEGYRFYGGPIDNEETGPEGQLNAWPMDESHVDYVSGQDGSGIVNNTTDFATLTTQTLIDQNENPGEENVATGYHAIEFLLWGQDESADGPGNRPYTDFVTDGSGTAENQERRGQYLQLATDLLIADLQSMVDAWAPNQDNYRKTFVEGDIETGLTALLTGMGSLSGAELAGERIEVAWDTKDQEDEHSCFSDNTHTDIIANAESIQNIYLGTYGSVSGASLSDLVRSRNSELDTTLKAQLAASVAAAKAIPVPFDQAILDDSVGRPAVKATVDALRAQTETIVTAATALGITLNLE